MRKAGREEAQEERDVQMEIENFEISGPGATWFIPRLAHQRLSAPFKNVCRSFDVQVGSCQK